MKPILKLSCRFLISASVIMLLGCKGKGVLPDREKEYKCTSTYPVLEIPRGMHAEPFQDSYTIPTVP
jgi:hypothetical protein